MPTPARAPRRRPRRRRVSAALLVSPLLLVAALGAQERFSERIAVTEVEVPVRVLVKNQPVAGLTRDDFELYDDGVRQQIIGFEVRKSTSRFVSPDAAEAPAPVAAAGRRLLLLFDFSYSRRLQLARALRDLQGSLDGLLRPGDRAAVATYGAISGLNLMVGFTDDREKLELALAAVEAMLDAKDRRQREALGRLHELRFGAGDGSTYATLAEEIGPEAALAVLSGPVVYDESEDDGVTVETQESLFGPIKVRVEVDRTEPIRSAQDAGGQVRTFGLSLTELAYLLREVPGRREMILYSEGFSGGALRDARSLFYLQKALRAMRDSGWMLHAVDVGGLASIDEASFNADSLLFLADGTGGELIEGTNDFAGATERVLQRTDLVYVLSFQPSERGTPGEFRKLEVKLTDPPRRAKVLHRPGYYATRPPAKREIFERRLDGAEWLLTNLEADELEVALEVEVVKDPAGGGLRVPVTVAVSGASLLDSVDGRTTRLEFQLAALDGDGAVRDLLNGETVLNLRSEAPRLRAGGVRFVGDLGVPPGDYKLRLLVRSHRNGEVVLATRALSVDAASATAAAASTERPGGEWIVVEAERRTAYFR